jgi:hypothetical protein
MNILAIDPGNEESAWCLINTDTLKPKDFSKDPNDCVSKTIQFAPSDLIVIERIASYGMAVGKEVFETCEWIGRFTELAKQVNVPVGYIYRRDEKLHICGSPKAKDSNIIQALKDRFGDKGTKKSPGFFYGFSKDIWQAYAVGLTYIETKLGGAQ